MTLVKTKEYKFGLIGEFLDEFKLHDKLLSILQENYNETYEWGESNEYLIDKMGREVDLEEIVAMMGGICDVIEAMLDGIPNRKFTRVYLKEDFKHQVEAEDVCFTEILRGEKTELQQVLESIDLLAEMPEPHVVVLKEEPYDMEVIRKEHGRQTGWIITVLKGKN